VPTPVRLVVAPHLIGAPGHRGGVLVIDGDRLEVIADGIDASRPHHPPPTIDATDLLVAPGFVDVQCNGGFGIDLAAEPERLWELGALLPRHGVTAWLPTIVTSPASVRERALATLAAGPPGGWSGAVPLGLHLEGPMLNPARNGAHDPRHLAAPSPDLYGGWSREAGVALVTLAPELPGGIEAVRALTAAGVVVSIGHTAASPADVAAAVEAGATSVTHLFNAMTPFGHRDPGVVGASLATTALRCGLIVDGIHLDPVTVAMAWRALGPKRTVLVTDAVAALGMPFGEQPLGAGRVAVGPDGVRLPDGTLAGSNLSAIEAVRNLIAFTGCEPFEAVAAMTASPSRLLGRTDRGVLEPARRADLVLLTGELDVVATVVGGQVVHEQPGGLSWRS